MEVELAGEEALVEVLPQTGGRIQRIVDRRSGRELLYQRTDPIDESTDFLLASTGGWDLLFPNDEAWRGHPDHGRLWTAPFAVTSRSSREVVLAVSLEDPPVEVKRRVVVLEAPRIGVRDEVEIVARADISPFLFAFHPMLAVATGWEIDVAPERRDVAADDDYPGRFSPGEGCDEGDWARLRIVPPDAPSVVEVVYVDGARSGELASRDGSRRTRVTWDAESLPHLWICTITGLPGHGTLVLLEPSTSRPYRLAEAISSNTAVTLGTGESWSSWTEVESLDSLPTELG